MKFACGEMAEANKTPGLTNRMTKSASDRLITYMLVNKAAWMKWSALIG